MPVLLAYINERKGSILMTNTFSNDLIAGVTITYLPNEKMFKIDYFSNYRTASIDVVKDNNGVIASLMSRSALIFGKYPSMTDADFLAMYFESFHNWYNEIMQPETTSTMTKTTVPDSSSSEKYTTIPAPNWE